MYGIFKRKENGNFIRVGYAKTKAELMTELTAIRTEYPDDHLVTEKLNWK